MRVSCNRCTYMHASRRRFVIRSVKKKLVAHLLHVRVICIKKINREFSFRYDGIARKIASGSEKQIWRQKVQKLFPSRQPARDVSRKNIRSGKLLSLKWAIVRGLAARLGYRRAHTESVAFPTSTYSTPF